MENKLRGNDFWGEGIPDYEKEDLMSKREILDFSIDIVLQFGTEKEVDPSSLNQPLETGAME